MERIEPFDEIQVFIKGTGRCLWGRILPQTADGNYVLALTTWPEPETFAAARGEHVEFRFNMDVQNIKDANGTIVHIPREAVDTVIGDDRYVD